VKAEMEGTVSAATAPPGVATTPDVPAASRGQWRLHTFGPASEKPYRRRTSDWLRLAIALAIVIGTCFHVGDLTAPERALFQTFNQLPGGLNPFFTALFELGSLWAVGLVVGAALIGRRWRLARDLVVAGVAASFVARLLGALIVDDKSLSGGLDVVTRLGDSPAYPVVRLAVLVAVICVASPYLTRPTRRVGQILVAVMALAALYLGIGYPNDAFAAIVLGWGIAAAVHLAFGTPGGRPTRAQVGAALADLGVDAHSVEIHQMGPREGTEMTAQDADGPIYVRVLGRDDADAQFLAKFWRMLFYKDGGHRVHLTRLEDVEEEGFVLLLAESAGVKVPHVLAAGVGGPGTALLASRVPTGARLSETDPELITDAVLADLWANVERLHDVHVAHGTLNARHVLVDGDSTALFNFMDAMSGAQPGRCSADVAELLVSTAGLVGNDRAIAAAKAVLGANDLAAALPFLQTPALSRDLRPRTPKARREFKKTLEDLRSATAAAVGVEEPALQPLARVSMSSLLMTFGTLFAVYSLLSQIGDPGQFWNTISAADFWWIAVALIVSFSTNIATAVVLMGTVPTPLPLWRTSELQLSMSFANLAVPAVGGMGSQVRFLQKQGVDTASAVAAGAVLSTVAATLGSIALFGIAVVLSPTTIQMGNIPTSSVVQALVLILLVLAIVGALIWFLPKLHKLVVPQLKSAMTTIGSAFRSPRRVLEMLVGSVVNSMLYGFVLLACVEAFGASINFWTLLAVNIFVGTIASLVPIPGGGTAVGAVGITGALTAAGVPTEVAVAAVLANQLVGSFIPALPGFFATKDLQNHDYL
jgi:uncharacterized membrane protein YbhN (UPF0104 family)